MNIKQLTYGDLPYQVYKKSTFMSHDGKSLQLMFQGIFFYKEKLLKFLLQEKKLELCIIFIRKLFLNKKKFGKFLMQTFQNIARLLTRNKNLATLKREIFYFSNQTWIVKTIFR